MRRRWPGPLVAALSVAALLSVGTVAPTRALGIAAVANPDAYSARHDRVLVVAAKGVLANDLNLSLLGAPGAVVVTPTGHGSLSLATNGGFTYSPNARFVGADSFTYRITGGLLASNTTTVSISVTNAAPVAVADSYTAATGRELSVNAPGILANDTDADGDALTSTLVSGGGSGSLGVNPDGSFSFTSGGSFVGTRTFTYRVSDGLASSSTATVSISVGAPTATATPAPTPSPTLRPTATPTPTLPLPTLPTPTLPLPTLPLPTLPVPTLPLPTLPVPTLPVPTSAPSRTPAATPVGSSTVSPPPTSSPSAASGAPASPTPAPTNGGSGGAGATGGSDPSTPTGSGDRALSVPSGPDRGPIAVGGLSLTIGAFQWLVPAFALSVPGLLLILVVLAQLVGGGLFLPVSRRALAGDGVAHRRGRRD